ncbi:MAG: dTDP-4-dehydrorhamnose reductase [Geodermatophilaceae bacterium]
MTRWLITGAGGQLGRDLVRQLGGQEVVALSRADLDLREESAVRGVVDDWLAAGGDDAVVVNAAAYTAVDAAETDEPAAAVVNAAAPGWLAETVRGRGRLLHVSTDYVFPGDSTTPYEPDDPTGPRTAYGRTKLAGERTVLIADPDSYVVRTAWVYAAHGRNFLTTMLRLEREQPTVAVVTDQLGSPTWAGHLAAGLIELAGSEARPGRYHCTGAGQATWHELARTIFSAAGADPDRVLAATSSEVVRPAPRPAFSVLSNASWIAAGLTPLPAWSVGVHEALASSVDPA